MDEEQQVTAEEEVEAGGEAAEPAEDTPEQSTETVSDEAEESGAVQASNFGGAYTALVRLGAGLVGTVLERAEHAGASLPEAAEAAEEDAAPSEDPRGAVLFGFAADLPDRIGRMTTSVSENTGPVRSLVSLGWRVTAASPIGRLISKPVDAVLERVDAEAERLSAIGRTEYAQGRVLFETVVDNAIDGVLDNVSESDALNELIRDQALGVGGAAIREIRETGAAADSLTDAIVRKMLRREPRSLPPKPEDGAE